MPTTPPRLTIDDIAVDAAEAEKLVTELMAIPGKSCQETEVASSIRDRLLAAGIPANDISFDTAHRRSPAGGESGNLIVKLPGTLREPRRLLMAHMDTVPLCVGSRPVRQGPLIVARDAHTGLGADDRAGVSVVLNAVLQIYRRNWPHPPLTLFFPVQEEIGLRGTRHASISKLGNPKFCFNWDGRQPELVCIGATGDDHLQIEIEGIPAHAGVHPEQGVSAIAVAAIAIEDLVRNGWHGLIVKGKQTGSSNVGVLHGGEATNVVTPHVTIKAEVRSHNPRFRQRIVREFERAFQKAASGLRNHEGKTARVDFHAEMKYEAFRLDRQTPCVQQALAAIRAVGLSPATMIGNGGIDANWMFQHGLPTVTLGCGQQNIHTADESLIVESYLQACRIALLLATGAV